MGPPVSVIDGIDAMARTPNRGTFVGDFDKVGDDADPPTYFRVTVGRRVGILPTVCLVC